MLRFFLSTMLLASPFASHTATSTRAFDILVEAQDCSTSIRVPSRMQLAIGGSETISVDSFSRKSTIALEVSLIPQERFRINGSFLTDCGDVAVDSTAPIGQTATTTHGKLSVRVTLTPAGS